MILYDIDYMNREKMSPDSFFNQREYMNALKNLRQKEKNIIRYRARKVKKQFMTIKVTEISNTHQTAEIDVTTFANSYVKKTFDVRKQG